MSDENKGFHEIDSGYEKDLAIKEAKRCLSCKAKPCTRGCPLNVDIPSFVNLVANEKFFDAYNKIKEKNNMPSICGRVCNQKCQCEKNCVRGLRGQAISIGKLERFVADWVRENKKDEVFYDIKNINKKIAIIGSGPSGLTCAKYLRLYGYDVTIFEKMPFAGGILMYGIPSFRLPKDIVSYEIDRLKDMGVNIKTNITIGEEYSIDNLLKDGFSAVYIATGAFVARFMNIEGEDADGVYQANDFLANVNLMNVEARMFFNEQDVVAVIGGGNVAMDVARTAKRLNVSNVFVIYRRSYDEMPARKEEIEGAKEDGVIFRFLENPKRILKDKEGRVCAIECCNMKLGDIDESGRRKVTAIKNSEHEIKVTKVILAIGQSPNTFVINNMPDIKTNDFGGIVVNEKTFASTKSGVFAGGDVVTSGATVTLAVKAGRDAAKYIHDYIRDI